MAPSERPPIPIAVGGIAPLVGGGAVGVLLFVIFVFVFVFVSVVIFDA